MLSRMRPLRFAAIALIGIAMAGSAYAFTASGTVSSSVASYGNGSVTAINVDDVSYNLLSGDATQVDTIVLTVSANPAGLSFVVNLGTAGVTTDCVASSANTITCGGGTNWLVAQIDNMDVTIFS